MSLPGNRASWGKLMPRVRQRRLLPVMLGGKRSLLRRRDIESAAENIRKRSAAELAADIVAAAHQERTPVHPLLNRTEWVSIGLAMPVQKPGPVLQAFGSPVQSRLVLQAGDTPHVCRAS